MLKKDYSFEDAWASKDKLQNLCRYNNIESKSDYDIQRIIEFSNGQIKDIKERQ